MALPVCAERATDLTGPNWVEVKYSVSLYMATARTRPEIVARKSFSQFCGSFAPT